MSSVEEDVSGKREEYRETVSVYMVILMLVSVKCKVNDNWPLVTSLLNYLPFKSRQ